MLAVDVSNTDDDVSLVDWSSSLTVNIFQTVTLFDEPFSPLEIL
jgi:hypothetical protein